MTPIGFPEQTTVFAKDQPEYLPLPARVEPFDPSGRTTFCWRLTFGERVRVLLSGVIWQQVLTFNHPLQPQRMTVDRPDFGTSTKD